MKTPKPNNFSVTINGRVAKLNDGALCFSSSKTAAIRDLRMVRNQWRGGSRRTAAGPYSGAIADEYVLKERGGVVGRLRVEEVKA